MKTYLISGGAGFIGTNLTKKLLSEGQKVICIDNLLTGRQQNIDLFLANKNYKYIQADICNPIEIKEHIDVIFNLACAASPPKYQLDPIHTIKTNVLGMLNILNIAREYKSVVFQASTSEIYGDPVVDIQDEEYWGNVNTYGDRACYDEGKRITETICYEYIKEFDVDVRVGRIFNTYGTYMDPNDGRVISNFITQGLSGQKITIYGNGKQTRSFCYIDDLVDALLQIVSVEKEKYRSFGRPINLGKSESY